MPPLGRGCTSCSISQAEQTNRETETYQLLRTCTMKAPSLPSLPNRFSLKTLLSIIACLGLAVLMQTPAQATDIGPDAYGYIATDTVPYAFEDISGTGTAVLAGADDETTTVPIGFTFNYYGADYTTVGLSPNGLVTFGGVNGQLDNVDLTSLAPTGDLPSVAVLWDDWVATAPGAVYYQTLGTAGARRFIVQWNQHMHFFTTPSTVTFQAIFYEANGSLKFQYLDVDAGNVSYDLGASATVGIRDTGGQSNGRRLQWSLNSGVIASGQAIQFRPTRRIGPDAYGYTAADVGPYAFEDISSSGTAALAGQDDTTTTAPVGFSFNFYGSNYTTVGLSPNGLVTFGGVNGEEVNVDLRTQAPSPSGDLPSVAVLWDDWVADPGAVYYQTLGTPGARRFIVQWHQHRHFSPGIPANNVTFQVILYEATQCLKLQFADVDVDAVNGWSQGGSATVGIRDTGGQVSGRVLQWSFNQQIILNGQSILFCPWGTGKVAVFGAEETAFNDDVRNKIASRMPNIQVDAFDVRSPQPVPTLDQLKQYKAVLVYSDDSFNDGTALGNVLADYVDAGGGVVLATFAYWDTLGLSIQGRLKTGGYLPFTTAGQDIGASLILVPDLPGHLILNGVTAFNGGTSSYHNSSITTTPGTELVAHWSNGQPLAAAKGVSFGRVVGLNFWPPSSDARSDLWPASTDGGLLMANALKWAGAPTFVVSVFDDPTYVDTTSVGVDPESDNVQASLQNRGFTTTTFTDVASAAATNRILLFPEQENAELAPALSAAARTALADFVAKGGLMIVHGTGIGGPPRRTATLLNTVFGFSVVESEQSGFGPAYARMAAATGTAFGDDPASLPFNNGSMTLTTASLPPGALSIYENAGQSLVALIHYGAGKIIFLGWDWYDAAPIGSQDGGWLQVLASAVTEAESLHPFRELVLDTTDRGWYDSTGYHDPGNDNYVVGEEVLTSELWRNFFVFNVPALTGPVLEAKLRVNSYTNTSPEGAETYELRAVSTPIATLLAGGSGLTGI